MTDLQRFLVAFSAGAMLLVAFGIWRWWKFNHSPIEKALARAMRKAGIPEPVPQFKVFAKKRVVTIPDFAWPDLQVAVFCDGWKAHGSEAVAISDAKKRNFMARTGWVVLVFHGRTILGQPDYCLHEIREALRVRESGAF